MVSKKNILKVTLATSLVISAPFTVFAFGMFENGNDDRSEMDRLSMLDERLEVKQEQATFLINRLTDDGSSVDMDRLEEIVDSFKELEEEVESYILSAENEAALKELFEETHNEARDLTTEFRGIIKESEILKPLSNETFVKVSDEFTDLEKKELRETLKRNDFLNDGIGKFGGHGGHGLAGENGLENFSVNYLVSVVSEDLATQYIDGDLTLREVMHEVKLILDEMSDEDRETLFEEAGIDMPLGNIGAGRFDGHDKGQGHGRGHGQGFGLRNN